VKPPSPTPCPSCPYRRDVPSGIWDRSEYDKLPAYDAETSEQPLAVFLCHQPGEQAQRICSGWAACHDLSHSLSLRFTVIRGELSKEDFIKTLEHGSVVTVPLFESGQAARDHGVRELDRVGERGREMIGKLDRQRQRQQRQQRRRGKP
jgi:hypothetical protein